MKADYLRGVSREETSTVVREVRFWRSVQSTFLEEGTTQKASYATQVSTFHYRAQLLQIQYNFLISHIYIGREKEESKQSGKFCRREVWIRLKLLPKIAQLCFSKREMAPILPLRDDKYCCQESSCCRGSVFTGDSLCDEEDRRFICEHHNE